MTHKENIDQELEQQHIDNQEEELLENDDQQSEPTSNETELSDLQQQVEELKDKYLRLYAEFENYKRRTVKEKLDMMKTAAQDTVSVLLPVLDDFDRAKKAAETTSQTGEFSEGIQLVYNKLHNALKSKGLQAMESNGHPFDASLHEAVTEIPAPTEDMKGKVVDTIEKGYFLNDKIIRHAKVVVGK